MLAFSSARFFYGIHSWKKGTAIGNGHLYSRSIRWMTLGNLLLCVLIFVKDATKVILPIHMKTHLQLGIWLHLLLISLRPGQWDCVLLTTDVWSESELQFLSPKVQWSFEPSANWKMLNIYSRDWLFGAWDGSHECWQCERLMLCREDARQEPWGRSENTKGADKSIFSKRTLW